MIIGIFGKTGTGKTVLLKRVIAQGHRVLVVDPLGKLGHLGVVPADMAEFKGYWRQQYNARWRIVLQPERLPPPPAPTDDTLRNRLDPYLAVARGAVKGSDLVWLVIDEVDTFGAIDREIRAVADYGRNSGLSLAFAARRPAVVDKTLTSQCSALYVFCTTGVRDLEYFRQVVGPQAAARLPGLRTHEALHWKGDEATASIVTVAPADGGSHHNKPSPTGGDRGGPSPVRKGGAPDPKEARAEGAPGPGTSPGRLVPSDCVVLTLGQLAVAYGYAPTSTARFRRLMIDSGRLRAERVARGRYLVRRADLPCPTDPERS